MKTPSTNPVTGNVLLLSLATILILSAVGANVLGNLTTRYNVSNTQVRGWKQAQHAAEAAGDIAYAELRKAVLDPTNAFSTGKGWTKSGDSYTSPVTTFGDANLVASSTVERIYNDDNGNPWYRIRARGTVPLNGLKRVTMDGRMNKETGGDSLLRKIDFNYDHFVAAYGPAGDGVGKALVPVAAPQLTRRLELVAGPITPFDAAIKASGTFEGLGNAALVDSYDSTEGAYSFVADSPSHPRYPNSHSGHVQIGSGVATVRGTIYGNVATNGGMVVRSTSSIKGTIDNNVPFSLPALEMPDTSGWHSVSSPSSVAGSGVQHITPLVATTPMDPVYYSLSSFSNSGTLQVNPRTNPDTGKAERTYVAVQVNGDIGTSVGTGPTIIVEDKVTLQVFFTGNFQTKAQNIINRSRGPNGNIYAGNLQFYGISPTNPSVQQTVDINSGGGSAAGFAAVFYTPSAKFTINGGPDITGSIICKTFYGNGNVTWHYDRQLGNLGRPVDYRIASYVEDTR